MGLTSLKRHEHSNVQLAEDIELTPATIHEQSLVLPNNNGEDLKLPLSELLYLETMQNYVAVYHTSADGTQKTLLRNTLKDLLPQLPAETVFQCHRSFAVNLDKITDIQGNSQGLTLTLANGLASAPVSRKYIPELKSLIEQTA